MRVKIESNPNRLNRFMARRLNKKLCGIDETAYNNYKV